MLPQIQPEQYLRAPCPVLEQSVRTLIPFHKLLQEFVEDKVMATTDQVGQGLNHDLDVIPLQSLHIDDHLYNEGVRVLLRPLDEKGIHYITPPDCGRPVILQQGEPVREKIASRKVPTIAIFQTAEHVKFTISQQTTRDLSQKFSCNFYFDPLNDNVIVQNTSSSLIELAHFSAKQETKGRGLRTTKMLTVTPTSWKLGLGESALELRIFTRRGPLVESQLPSQQKTNTLKRTFQASEEDFATGSRCRQRVVTYLGNVVPCPVQPTNVQRSSDRNQRCLHLLSKNETLHLPGVDIVKQYNIIKLSHLASRPSSEVYIAYHSIFGDCVVKVLKTSTY